MCGCVPPVVVHECSSYINVLAAQLRVIVSQHLYAVRDRVCGCVPPGIYYS